MESFGLTLGLTFKAKPQVFTKKKAVRLPSNCLILGEPSGALRPRRCIVSFSELRQIVIADSRMSHAHTSMFFTGMQFR